MRDNPEFCVNSLQAVVAIKKRVYEFVLQRNVFSQKFMQTFLRYGIKPLFYFAIRHGTDYFFKGFLFFMNTYEPALINKPCCFKGCKFVIDFFEIFPYIV